MAVGWGPNLEKVLESLKIHEEIPSTKQVESLNFLSSPLQSKDLMYVLAKMTHETINLRTLSGSILRANIGRSFHAIQPDDISYLQSECLIVLDDPCIYISVTASSLVSIIACKWGIWNELSSKLKNMVRTDDVLVCSTALDVIKNIYEDCPTNVLKDEGLFTLVLECIPLLEHWSDRIRYRLVVIVFLFLGKAPSMNQVDRLLKDSFSKVMTLAKERKTNEAGQDEAKEIREIVCKICKKILDFVDLLNAYKDKIIENVLVLTEDPVDDVVRQACEFWSTLARKKELCKELLPVTENDAVGSGDGQSEPKRSRLDAEAGPAVKVPCLERLLNSLIKRVRLTDGDLSSEDTEPNFNIPDSSQDVSPRFDRGGDEEKEDLLLLDGAISGWNLRDMSSTVLENLSLVYFDELLPKILPILKRTSKENSWMAKESVVHALGSIAVGCASMKDELPNLLVSTEQKEAFLFGQLFSKHKVIVRSTCWTLDRYADFVVSDDRYLQPVMDQILGLVHDDNKRVQGAACAALMMFQVKGGKRLVPRLGQIMRSYVKAYGDYQRKNRGILYDAIGAFARSVDNNQSDSINLVMPLLMAKWDLLKDDVLKDNALVEDIEEFFHLLESLSPIAAALQLGFSNYLEPVIGHCIKIIKITLYKLDKHLRYPKTFKSPDHDFMILAMDLVSNIIKGMGSEVEPHLDNLIQDLLEIMQLDFYNYRVLKSAFALLGNLTKACIHHVSPLLSELMPILAKNVKSKFPSVCANAMFALGEIVVKLGKGMTRYIGCFHFHNDTHNEHPLIDIMNLPKAPKVLLWHTAITLGRLGLIFPELLGNDLQLFAKRWCTVMQNAPNCEGKETAFRGILNMMSIYPNKIDPHFLFFCKAVGSYVAPPADLRAQFNEILIDYKSGCSLGDWNRFIEQLKPSLRERILLQYGV